MIRIILLLTFIITVSCQDYNSNSADRVKYGPVVLNESDPNFARAYNIIQSRCVSCHSSTIHDPWATYQDNAAWIDSGLVQRQDSQNSYFIQRIINYGGASSNMPQGQSALSQSDYEHLVKWIDEMP